MQSTQNQLLTHIISAGRKISYLANDILFLKNQRENQSEDYEEFFTKQYFCEIDTYLQNTREIFGDLFTLQQYAEIREQILAE